jgi:quinol monooxygenase YgiN
MTGLTVIARAKAKTGREKELEQAMRAVVTPTHQESGCLRYTLHRSLVDPAVFITVERWTSKEAIDQHFATLHIQALMKKIPDLLLEPPDITLYDLLPEGESEKARL